MTAQASNVIWAVNPDLVPKAGHIDKLRDAYTMKRAAERRMAVYDKQPKAVRAAIGQYSQIPALYGCRSRRAADKVAAIVAAYQDKMRRTAVAISSTHQPGAAK